MGGCVSVPQTKGLLGILYPRANTNDTVLLTAHMRTVALDDVLRLA